MTWEQRDAFLEAGGGRRARRDELFAVLAKAGLRPGEVFALKPGDIDWGERTLRVERAWMFGPVKPTKTYEERTVDLTPELVRALAQHMTWLKAELAARSRAGASSNGYSRTTRASRTTRRACGRCSSAAMREGEAPGLPALRPAPHLRVPSSSPSQRADHVRERPAQARESVDDAPLLRALDPEQGTPRRVDLLDRR